MVRDAITYLRLVLAYARGEDDGVNPAQRDGEPSYLAGDPEAEEVEGFPGRGMKVLQQDPDVAAFPGDAEQSATAVEEILETICVVEVVAQKVDDSAGIERARPGRHRNSVQRREAHAGVYANAVDHPAKACAASNMRADDTPGDEVGIVFPEFAGDVLIGKTVEAVSADTCIVQRSWNGEPCDKTALRRMECRIE